MIHEIFAVSFPLCMMYSVSDYNWNLYLERVMRENKGKLVRLELFPQKNFQSFTVFLSIHEMLYSFGENTLS